MFSDNISVRQFRHMLGTSYPRDKTARRTQSGTNSTLYTLLLSFPDLLLEAEMIMIPNLVHQIAWINTYHVLIDLISTHMSNKQKN